MAFVPIGVSFVVMVLSVERYQRRVVAVEERVPVLLTVAVRVMVSERTRLVRLELMLTMRSRGGGGYRRLFRLDYYFFYNAIGRLR